MTIEDLDEMLKNTPAETMKKYGYWRANISQVNLSASGITAEQEVNLKF